MDTSYQKKGMKNTQKYHKSELIYFISLQTPSNASFVWQKSPSVENLLLLRPKKTLWHLKIHLEGSDRSQSSCKRLPQISFFEPKLIIILILFLVHSLRVLSETWFNCKTFVTDSTDERLASLVYTLEAPWCTLQWWSRWHLQKISLRARLISTRTLISPQPLSKRIRELPPKSTVNWIW